MIHVHKIMYGNYKKNTYAVTSLQNNLRNGSNGTLIVSSISDCQINENG